MYVCIALLYFWKSIFSYFDLGKTCSSLGSHWKGPLNFHKFRRRIFRKNLLIFFKLVIRYLFVSTFSLACCALIQCSFHRFLEFRTFINSFTDWTRLWKVTLKNRQACFKIAPAYYSGRKFQRHISFLFLWQVLFFMSITYFTGAFQRTRTRLYNICFLYSSQFHYFYVTVKAVFR